jgi:hypothetical protein
MTPNPTNPNAVHSVFAWNAHVDNVEFTDVGIFNTADPANPVLVNDTLDLWDLFDVQQESPWPHLGVQPRHDGLPDGRAVHDERQLLDGGYALLGVTDPTRAKSPSSSRVTTPSSTSSG